jgi:hypothetical protein
LRKIVESISRLLEREGSCFASLTLTEDRSGVLEFFGTGGSFLGLVADRYESKTLATLLLKQLAIANLSGKHVKI